MTSREGKGDYQNWEQLRNHAIELFNGETPHPVVEQTIIDAYQLHPTAVERELAKVAADLNAGTIRSGWGIYAKRAERILMPPSNPTAKTGLDKERAVARAEQWIKTTGCHFDRDTEILEELFDSRGLLHAYAQIEIVEDTSDTGKWKLSEPTGDTALVERMTKHYHDARPAGITIEQDAHARAEKFKQHQAELAAMKAELTKIRTPAPRKPLPDIDYSADPQDDPEQVNT